MNTKLLEEYKNSIKGNIFDEMLAEENRQLFLRRKMEGFDFTSKELEEFKEYIPSEECTQDILRLKNGDYYLDLPRMIFAKKRFTTKKRKVYLFYGKERMLLKYMAFILHKFDGLFPDTLYSFRLNHGVPVAYQKIKKIDFHREHYVFKTDIKGYGNSVDQDLLLEIVKPLFENDPEFYNFLTWLLTRNAYYHKGEVIKERCSIIDGVPIGGFLTNCYLLELDRKLNEKAALVIRYTDDIAVFCRNMDDLNVCRELILDVFGDRKLTMSERKTEIYEPGEAFDLLGLRAMDGNFDVAEESKAKILRKMKRRKRRLLQLERYGTITKEEGLQSMVRFANRYFYGRGEKHEINWAIAAFPIITRVDSIREMDHYIHDCIRTVATGKDSNAKYRFKYEQIQQAGYISLVNSYYHGIPDAEEYI